MAGRTAETVPRGAGESGVPRRSWRRIVITLGLGALTWTGCARTEPEISPRPGPVPSAAPAAGASGAAAVQQDPAGSLLRVHAATRALDDYTLLFVRYERRGLFPRMHGPEHIQAWFRREPFSVRMKWLDEDLKYGESSYVAGKYDDKVRFVTRWWTPPLLPPPGINKVDLKTPVTWGESKRPLTDFGLEKLLERTLTSLEAAGDQVVVTYEGLAQMPEFPATVHHVRLTYSDPVHEKVPIQELYIDAATDLPAGTILKQADGRIDAAYYYQQLRTDVTLTDADFLLAPERNVATTQPVPAADTTSYTGDEGN